MSEAQQTTTPPDVLDDADAAELLKVGRIVIRKMARRGDLPCQRLGKEYRFSRAALMDWLAYGNEPDARPSRRATPGPNRLQLPPARPLLRLRSEERKKN